MARNVNFEVEVEPGKTTKTQHTQIEFEAVVTHVWTFKEILQIIFACVLTWLAVTFILAAANQNRAYSGASISARPQVSAPARSSTVPTRDLSISSNRGFVECPHTSVRGLPCFHGNRRSAK